MGIYTLREIVYLLGLVRTTLRLTRALSALDKVELWEDTSFTKLVSIFNTIFKTAKLEYRNDDKMENK